VLVWWGGVRFFDAPIAGRKKVCSPIQTNGSRVQQQQAIEVWVGSKKQSNNKKTAFGWPGSSQSEFHNNSHPKRLRCGQGRFWSRRLVSSRGSQGQNTHYGGREVTVFEQREAGVD